MHRSRRVGPVVRGRRSAGGLIQGFPAFSMPNSYVPNVAAGVDLNWNNEPGYTLVSDLDFSVAFPAGSGDQPYTDGWGIVGSGDGVARISDGTAPKSAPWVAEYAYPIGFTDGAGPGTIYHDLANCTRYYVGFWWKPSNPWENHSSGTNKILFFYVSPQTMYLNMRNDHIIEAHNFVTDTTYPNNGAGTVIQLGTWNKIECLLNKTGSIFKVWVNDLLQLDYTGVTFGTFDELKINPTWGGNVGQQKTENDFYYYDHVRLTKQ